MIKITALKQIYFFIFLFGAAFFLSVNLAEAATLSVSPGTGVYQTGAVITARVVVNTEGKPINAAEGTLTFNPAELAVVSVNKGGVFTLWPVEPSFSNSAGTVSFGGGSPSGFTGAQGTILSVSFRVKTAGTSKVGITKGSVLAADGQGTNVLRSQNGATYTLSASTATPDPEVVIEYVPPANTPAAPVINSATHPDPSKWYKDNKVTLNWSLPSDVTAVRTLLDNTASAVPSKVYDSPISEITIAELEQGVQYFHIQFKNSDGWGRITHFRLAIDSEAPTKFEISEITADKTVDHKTHLDFVTEDKTSEVNRFLITIDNTEPIEFVKETATSTFSLPSLTPGQHNIVVEGFDQAGNSITDTITLTIVAFAKPIFTDYPERLSDKVIPVIKGLTKPDVLVKVSFSLLGGGEEQVGVNQEYEVRSNQAGEFTVIPTKPLSLGVYEIRASAVDDYGVQSEMSDTVRMIVEQPNIIKFGGFVIDVLSVIIPLLALLVLLFVTVLYSRNKLRNLRRGVRKEAREAAAILESEFTKINQTLETEKSVFQDSRKSGKLTKNEEVLFTNLTNQISLAHKTIAKEIADVDIIIKK